MKQAGPLYTVRGAGALILSVAAAWGSTASASDLTGHVDVVSRYYLRGQTSTYGNTEPLGNALADAPESDHPALQWGADYVHDSGFLSLVPYIPAFGGMLLLGWWLREDRKPRAARTPAAEPVLMPAAETEPKQP